MNKLAPQYGRATSNPEMSLAAITFAGGWRVDGRFRKCADIGSVRWETVDDFNHDYLKYPTQRDYTGVVLSFRYQCSASHKPTDSNQAPSLTIRAAGADYEVRLKHYATRVSGANTRATGYVVVSITGGGSIGTITSLELNSSGPGYTIGDILTVSGGNNNATVRVDDVWGDGTIRAISLQNGGSGYSVANGVSCTGGTGSGATVNILAVTTAGSVYIKIGLISGNTNCTPSYTFTNFGYNPQPGDDAAAIATGLANALNASGYAVTAVANGNTVNLTAVEANFPGIDGNGIQLQVVSSNDVTLTPSSSRLSGGVSSGVWDVAIDFATVKSGFDNNISIPTNQVEKVQFNFVSQNYQNFPDGLDPEDFVVEFSNWSVTGSGAFWFDEPAALRRFPGLGVAVDCDDLSDKTPEWIVYTIKQLGFTGLIDIYVGAQRFYDKVESGSGPSGWIADTTKTFNPAASAWLTDLAARLATAGFKTVWAFSLELGDPSSDWIQHDYLDNNATTTYGYLLSPTDPDVLAWQKALYLATAGMVNGAGLEINLQFGEFWWWWRPQNNAPCFYDQGTKDQYAAEHGGSPLPTYTDKATTNFSQTTAEWLRDKLGAYSLAIRDHVQATYAAAKFGPLYFPPSVEPYPLMAVVNLPVNHWKQSEVDFFISETYDWVTAEPPEFQKSQRAMVRPINDPALGFTRANTWHLSGFVSTPGSLVEWAKVTQNTRMAYAWKRLGQVGVWSLSQVARDSWVIPGVIYAYAESKVVR